MTVPEVKLSQSSTIALRMALILFMGLDVLLLGLGIGLHPTMVSSNFFALLFVQGIYGGSIWFGLKGTHDATETRFGLLFGVLIAIVFVGEIILELLVTLDDNTPLGTAEFGTVFVLLFIAGLSAAWHSGSTRSAIMASIWAALLGSLVWYAALLSTYYLFRNTPQQQHAFLAEGIFDDFRRSGMADFETFVLQDFWGAGFYHLLLTPLFALILGGAGQGLGGLVIISNAYSLLTGKGMFG